MLVLRAFEKQVRDQVAEAAPDTQPEASGAACPTLAPGRKRKRRLFEDTDDEREEDSSHGKSVCPDDEAACSQKALAVSPKRSKGRTLIQRAGFTKIQIGDTAVKVGFAKGPGLQLEADTDGIRHILEHINDNWTMLLREGRQQCDALSNSRLDSPHALLKRLPAHTLRKGKPVAHVNADTDTNKVRFDFTRAAFTIIYEDKCGQCHRLSKGFEVPRVDPAGRLRPNPEYQELKHAVLEKARRAWNAFDESDKPRLPESCALA